MSRMCNECYRYGLICLIQNTRKIKQRDMYSMLNIVYW